ncbi:MAG: polysaccharide deacetylase family protein [Nitrososphaerota archaeon]
MGHLRVTQGIFMYFVMTVDVDPPPPSAPYLNIEEGLIKLLKLFKRYNVMSTFFVTATMAEKFPDLMQKIVEDKHEIACHDLDHSVRINSFRLIDLIKRIKVATELIESSSGFRPIGYRAPLFRINRKQWIALVENQYLYDSSVVRSPIYEPRYVFYPSKPFSISLCQNKHLVEIPLSISPLLFAPIGGTYLRIFGAKWAKFSIKFLSALGLPIIFYIHPKDVVARTDGPKWYSYKNTAKCIYFVEEIIQYATKTGATFMRAIDLLNALHYV